MSNLIKCYVYVISYSNTLAHLQTCNVNSPARFEPSWDYHVALFRCSHFNEALKVLCSVVRPSKCHNFYGRIVLNGSA